jgi:hypothetical protein
VSCADSPSPTQRVCWISSFSFSSVSLRLAPQLASSYAEELQARERRHVARQGRQIEILSRRSAERRLEDHLATSLRVT